MSWTSLTEPFDVFGQQARLIEQERPLDHLQHARQFFGEAVAPHLVVSYRIERNRDQSLTPIGETTLLSDRLGFGCERIRGQGLPGPETLDCVAWNERECIDAEPTRTLLGRDCAAATHDRYSDPVCCGDGARRVDEGGWHRTAEDEGERPMEIKEVLEIGGRHGRSEEEDPEPLECERAGDDPGSESVGVGLRTGDDDCRSSRLLRDRAESYQELVNRGACGMFEGDSDVAGRPSLTELGLYRA